MSSRKHEAPKQHVEPGKSAASTTTPPPSARAPPKEDHIHRPIEDREREVEQRLHGELTEEE